MSPNRSLLRCLPLAAVVALTACASSMQPGALSPTSARVTNEALDAYRRFAATLGLPSAKAYSVGTEVAVEAEKIGVELIQRYPKAMVVAGQIIFEEEKKTPRLSVAGLRKIIQGGMPALPVA